MNEKIWYDMFKGYIRNYESITDLERCGILGGNGEQYQELMRRLLSEIIETFRSEVER